jgi:hypothetical protein
MEEIRKHFRVLAGKPEGKKTICKALATER